MHMCMYMHMHMHMQMYKYMYVYVYVYGHLYVYLYLYVYVYVYLYVYVYVTHMYACTLYTCVCCLPVFISVNASFNTISPHKKKGETVLCKPVAIALPLLHYHISQGRSNCCFFITYGGYFAVVLFLCIDLAKS